MIEKLIAVHTEDGRKEREYDRQLLSAFALTHGINEAVIDAIEAALLADLIANKYE